MSDSVKLELARELIRSLLADGPMKGATLKLRMLRDFEQASGEAFDAAFRIYPKFSSFLAANNDLVQVSRPSPGVPGDITVRLRQGGGEEGGGHQQRIPLVSPDCYLPTDVWQALTNPDPQRLRFFNRRTHKVEHYIEGKQANGLENSPEWVEIEPASAETQAEWMHKFIKSEPLPEGKRAGLLAIADLPYSSNTNAVFNRALAEYAPIWRRFRAGMVMQLARDWCEGADIPFEDISRPTVKPSAVPLADNREASLRSALIKAIQAATLEELRQIAIPASLLITHLHADGR